MEYHIELFEEEIKALNEHKEISLFEDDSKEIKIFVKLLKGGSLNNADNT